jgi:hypothetical protein
LDFLFSDGCFAEILNFKADLKEVLELAGLQKKGEKN